MNIKKLIREELQDIDFIIESFDEMIEYELPLKLNDRTLILDVPATKSMLEDKTIVSIYALPILTHNGERGNTEYIAGGFVYIYHDDMGDRIKVLHEYHINEKVSSIELFPEKYHNILYNHFFETYLKPLFIDYDTTKVKQIF